MRNSFINEHEIRKLYLLSPDLAPYGIFEDREINKNSAQNSPGRSHFLKSPTYGHVHVWAGKIPQ